MGVEESVAIRNTPDFEEGLAAFLEKRKPKWSA
jgi:enoyl-CoA hydratase/carnithine racemase